MLKAKSKRPDKTLNRMLLLMSYSLVALAVSIILLFAYPENNYIMAPIVLLMLTFCIYIGIKTVKAGEEAISYGGFANTIIENGNNIKRIDNSSAEAVIENKNSKDFFKGLKVLIFLEESLSSNPINKFEFQNLTGLVDSLSSGKAILSLNLNKKSDTIFEKEEWIEIEVNPIFLKKTNIFEKPFSIEKIREDTYISWNITNITTKKDMDTIFQEELNFLHDNLDYLPTGIYICDSNYTLEYVNDSFAKTLNETREELVGKNIKDLLDDSNQTPPKAPTWKGRVLFKNKDGEKVSCYISQERFRYKGNIKIRGIISTNLPTEKQLQEELDTVLDKIYWLFDISPTGIIFMERNQKISKLNNAANAIFGETKDTILGKNLLEYIDDEDLHKFNSLLQSSENETNIDISMKFKDTKKTITLNIINIERTKTTKEDGFDGWLIYMNDATKQKDLEMQFAQAQKMQAMGQLAGGIAHDFNNLLTAMIGFCDLLLQRHGVGDPSFADLIQIKQNANRAAGLVRQLLAFSRKQPLKPKLIDVTENFLEINHMLKRILGENIRVNYHHGDNLGFIKVDPVQFSQVIINLSLNAKDAMKENGKLDISTKVETLKKEYHFGEDIIKPGEFVVINVKDNGSGIAPENITRIFEPFFSTKQNIVGSGTGLGLSMVYGIVRQTGGFIKVSSKLDVGTTFSIYLPRFEYNEEGDENAKNNDAENIIIVKEKITPSVNISQKVILGLNVSTIDRVENNKDFDPTKIRIMFVEDEDSVRAFAVRALKKKGYDVVACDSAETALLHLENDLNFHLLITDMVMPGISGAELANIVKNKIKDIKIILASGYSEEIARKELSNNDSFEFMAKPFSLGDLTKKVFEILNS